MATKLVEMAVRDPANAQRFVSESVEVEIVRVTIRNRDRRPAGRIFSDVICGEVKFRPGQVKTLEVSAALATELKARKDPTWELVKSAPTLDDDDEQAFEEVSEEEQPADDDDDAPVRHERVQRRRAR